MKKVLFIQNKGNTLGGVWFVNKIVGESLIEKGYSVEILSIRSGNDLLEHNIQLKTKTINKKTPWEIVHKGDILKSLKQKKIDRAILYFFLWIRDSILLKKDFLKTKQYIKKQNPDYIITTHYEVLNAIPKKYLNRVIHEHHSSFQNALDTKNNINTLMKYNNKINFLWLCENTLKKAQKYGLKKNHFIYNPIKFTSSKRANVVENKKLITISRLSSSQKRIDLMIDIVKDVLKEFPEWTLELYGDGMLDLKSENIIQKNPQIKKMGRTDDVKKVLLNSSIYLSTSYYEGFSLSILEANECGIPCISYDFGESCSEEIQNGKTGYIIPFHDKETYQKKLKELIQNKDLLEKLSKNAKEFSLQFSKSVIVEEWIKLFHEIECEK